MLTMLLADYPNLKILLKLINAFGHLSGYKINREKANSGHKQNANRESLTTGILGGIPNI